MALSDYITSTLGSLATYSGWVAGDSTFVISNALRLYGVSLEADATDLTKLYAITDICLYKKLLSLVSVKYDISEDGASFKRNQVYLSVKDLYQNSLTAGMVYLPSYKITKGKITNNSDPYGIDPIYLI